MSHFTVMVIGDDYEAQLAPYHEYECTGVDDEYVIDVDITDEVDEWKQEKLWVGISKESGELDYYWDDKSADNNLEEGWETMTRLEYFDKKGLDVVEETKDWFGGFSEDGKHYRHTNPNAKWDWYQVGGRWSGFFRVKDPFADNTQQGDQSWTNAGQLRDRNYADMTTKGNINIQRMMDERRAEAETEFDRMAAAMGDTTPVSWTQLRESVVANGGTIDDAREQYHDTPFMKSIRAYERENDTRVGYFLGDMYEDYYLHLPLNVARVRYVETAAMNALTPFAFIKDGEWVEKGEMGWWGAVHDEMDKDEWSKQFIKMFTELPDDTMITLVDCHI